MSYNSAFKPTFAAGVISCAAAPAMAQAGSPDVSNVISHTPVWVWPLFVLLLIMGWMHSRDRVVAKLRLLVQPLVFTGIGISSFLINGASAFAATALLVMMAIGLMVGQMLGRRDGATIDAAGNVHVPGEWISMALILIIFASRFAAGAAQGIAPAMVGSALITVPLAMISGFTIGLTLMRALVQTGLRR